MSCMVDFPSHVGLPKGCYVHNPKNSQKNTHLIRTGSRHPLRIKKGKFHLQKVSKHFHLQAKQTSRSPWDFRPPPTTAAPTKPCPVFFELQKVPLFFFSDPTTSLWSSPRGWCLGVTPKYPIEFAASKSPMSLYNCPKNANRIH